MADARRRPVAPVRKLVAGVLGTLAAFIVLFGAGMQSWAIVALGVAVVVLAISLVAVTTIRGGARAWVQGTAHVVSASPPPTGATYGRCELQILIEAPGLPGASIKVREPRVPVTKWPDRGANLPISVAVDDIRHVRIRWDDVLTHADAAAAGFVSTSEPDVGTDPIDDDELFAEEEPPWARRHDDTFPGAEPVTADLTDDLGGGIRDEPVVVHQAPGGPIVLEGTLVEPTAEPRAVPLPRRATASPDHNGGPAANGSASTEATADAAGDDSGEPAPDALIDDDILGDFITTFPSANPGRSGSIHGVGMTLLVADLDRSIQFYRDMLGFHEIDKGEGNAVLASGDTRIVLRTLSDLGPTGPRTVHLNLEVGDVTAMYEELKAKGVKFTYGPRSVNRGAKLDLWAAAFRDPDGHGIALTQWRGH
ncbi:VOC family protein [Actinomycetes bacterium KLBMP 9797]